MGIRDEVAKELSEILAAAKKISPVIADDVQGILALGKVQPINQEDLVCALTELANRVREHAAKVGDTRTLASTGDAIEDLVSRIVSARNRASSGSLPVEQTISAEVSNNGGRRVQLLEEHDGVKKGRVHPTPVYQGKQIPMIGGFARTQDLELWVDNERLDIQIRQFKGEKKREPTAVELYMMMVGQYPLEGIDQEDAFEIMELARSIASNGVRVPPIISVDGRLLDGNRRVAACKMILSEADGEFTDEEKSRAEKVFVWQLNEYASPDDERRVTVSLNFEDDLKEEWPKYVKAKKIFQEWRAILDRLPEDPDSARQRDLKKDLAKRYAITTDDVNQYIKMMRMATDFREYHVDQKGRNSYEVEHKISRFFEYFDELTKGERPGGVAHCLGQDEGYKGLVFDLLYQGKFTNWTLVRQLKHAFQNDEARGLLRKAAEQVDVDEAQDLVENALAMAKTRSAEKRALGWKTKIEDFVKWLEDVPPKVFRDDMAVDTLNSLLRALKLVEPLVREGLAQRGSRP